MGDERGAIIVLTSLCMVTMVTFSAFAVDIGQRNQQLARAQHAIDAAVITAAQYLATPGNDADYAGAIARTKEVVRENLGIAVAAWATCTDTNHLPTVVLGDTECVSFQRTEAAVSVTGKIAHSIRVKLPAMDMDTIFGGAIGVNRIDLAAVAASNGNNCAARTVGCDLATTSIAPTTTTTTIPATTTTQSLYNECTNNYSVVTYAFDDAIYQRCAAVIPPFDVKQWRYNICTSYGATLKIPVLGTSSTWDYVFPTKYSYLYYWGTCQNYIPDGAALREKYITSWCNTSTISRTPVPIEQTNAWQIYNDWTLYVECLRQNPTITEWNAWWDGYWKAYNATTTTTTAAPPTTAGPTIATTTTTTTTIPVVTTPGSIDING